MHVGETAQETVTPPSFPVGRRGKKAKAVLCLHCVGWPSALDVHVVNTAPGKGGGVHYESGSKPFRH